MRLRPIHAALFVAVVLGDSSVGRALRAERAEPDAPPPPSLSPDRTWLGAETCQASPPRELGRSSVRNLRLRVASQPESPRPAASYAHRATTLAAWSMGEHVLATRGIGAELGALREVALDHGMNLAVLAPAGEQRFLAVATHPLCRNGAACVRAIGLGPDGAASGAAYAPEPSDQETSVVSSALLREAGRRPSGVAVAFSSRWGFNDIDLFRLDAAGQVVVEPHPIHTEYSGGSPIAALTASGEQVVAYGSESAVDEDGDEHQHPFVLALGSRRQGFPASVPIEADLTFLRLDGTTLDMVFRVPHSAPRWLRVSTVDGSLVAPTTQLGADTATPFAPVLPSLRIVRGRVTLERRDLRGQAIGAPLALGPGAGTLVSDWAWEGESLHVVWATRQRRTWIVSESHIACPAM